MGILKPLLHAPFLFVAISFFKKLRKIYRALIVKHIVHQDRFVPLKDTYRSMALSVEQVEACFEI
jgi:uncharacterized membrane protein YbaN (DUF454 family)